jgi:hypothetical protein
MIKAKRRRGRCTGEEEPVVGVTGGFDIDQHAHCWIQLVDVPKTMCMRQ